MCINGKEQTFYTKWLLTRGTNINFRLSLWFFKSSSKSCSARWNLKRSRRYKKYKWNDYFIWSKIFKRYKKLINNCKFERGCRICWKKSSSTSLEINSRGCIRKIKFKYCGEMLCKNWWLSWNLINIETSYIWWKK